MNQLIEEYRKMDGNNIMPNHKRKERIVMLISAGFSVAKGYPSGKALNEMFCKFMPDEFYFAPNGELMSMSIPKSYCKTDYIHDYSVYHKSYLLLCELIKYYVNKYGKTIFDYERFYDAIDIDYRKEEPLCFDIWSEEYSKLAAKYLEDDLPYERLVANLTTIYDQLIAFFLKGKRNSFFYENAKSSIDYDKDYFAFLYYLKEKSKDCIIDVFSTNHDLVFESFCNIQDFRDLISDGFDDYGSEYFGEIEIDGFKYKCRLERYTGKYNTPIRLYKLHGSLDYMLYHKNKKVKRTVNGNKVEENYAIPLKYVKIKQGVNPYDIVKSTRCKRKYEYSSTAIRPDFLSGVQTKIKRYNNPLLYKKLFRQFAKCLREADKLIIIGYGCNDRIINEYINKNFNDASKRTYMINPDAFNLVSKLEINIHPIPEVVDKGFNTLKDLTKKDLEF